MTLLSARGAALFAGCLLWHALMREARAAFPGLVAGDILDCGPAPGRALEALRLGQAALVLDRASIGFEDVRLRAEAIGAVVLGTRPPSLDIARDGTRRLSAHLGVAGRDSAHDFGRQSG